MWLLWDWKYHLRIKRAYLLPKLEFFSQKKNLIKKSYLYPEAKEESYGKF